MADNAAIIEIREITKQISEIRHEALSLPSDVALAYNTDRSELLKVAVRSMTAAEVEAVLDALAGQMRLRRLLERLNELQFDIIVDIRQKLVGSQKALEDVAAMLKL